MEIGEAIAMAMEAVDNQDENFCDGKTHPSKKWKARIDGYGATPTAEQLFKNMKTAKMKVPDEPKKIGAKWDLDDCGPDRFPFQSHHLIPKKHLPGHPVCLWLTAKYTDDPKYQLAEDTNFDTDHARNGYFMPFVSNCAQWKKAGSDEKKKSAVAEDMMKRTRVQLHQGSHSAESFTDEVDDIETGGYLTVVDLLLTAVVDGALDHVETCTPCKKGANKIKVQPLEKVAGHVYTVAELLKLLLIANRIFVSERAADLWKKNPI